MRRWLRRLLNRLRPAPRFRYDHLDDEMNALRRAVER